MKNDVKPLAVITGASRGIGLELAQVFASNGYDLIINSNSSEISNSADQLRASGCTVEEVEADLATQEGADELYQVIQNNGRPVDVLVLNAGVAVGGAFVDNNFVDELVSMNLNMTYLVYLTKKVLRDMMNRNQGKILFTSSIAAEMPGPYYAVYAASKSFVQSFAEALHFEMKDTGKNITITALQPGATDTDFFRRADLQNSKAAKSEKDDPRQVAQQGYDALMAGKDHVVAGSFMNKVQVAGAKIISEQQSAATHAKEIRPE